MAANMEKRKAPGDLEVAAKRIRIRQTSQISSAALDDDNDDEDDENYKSEDNVDSENGERADTPITPFSPSRKKFRSELKIIRCTYEGCTKTFNRPARLTAHLRSHTNERPFVCQYENCGKAYLEDKHLQQHIKGSHTHERPFHCDWEGCSKSFLTSTRLNRHKDTHVGHERFRCTAYPPCNQTFRKHQTLQRHIRSDHMDLAPFPCTYVDPATGEQCASGFDGPTGLRQHMARAHGPAVPPQFPCPDCDCPGFKTQKQLQVHMRKEHLDCMFCGIKFTSQQTLVSHIESQHSGATLDDRKNVVCPHEGCGKRYTKQNNLNAHIRNAHLGERFVCGSFDLSMDPDLESFDDSDGCGRDFTSKVGLVDHIRTAHLGLPRLLRAKRNQIVNMKDGSFIDDDEDEGGYLGPPRRSKRKVKKEKASVIDEFLGLSYGTDPKRNIPCRDPTCPHLFIREYDRQVHMEATHPFYEHPDSPALPPIVEPGFQYSAPGSSMTGTGPAPSLNAHSLQNGEFDQTDIDWELQRQVLEGGPFWVGGVEQATSFSNQDDEWTQEQLEMRKLIG